MNATRRHWYVEDQLAEQRLAAVDPDAMPVRLDRPGWGHLASSNGDRPVGMAVGRGHHVTDLAAALADLARDDDAMLLVPMDFGPDLAWLTAATTWRVAEPATEHGDCLLVRVAPQGPGPTLAALAALHARAPRQPTRPASPWRLGLRDATARAWFGDLPSVQGSVALAIADAASDPAAAGDHTATAGNTSHLRIVTSDTGAATRGDGVVALTDDPVLATDGVRLLARPVDLRRWSPAGCRPRAASQPPVLPMHRDGQATTLPEVRELARAAATDMGMTDQVAGVVLPDDGLPPSGLVRDLRDAVALLDHPAVHAGPASHARWLLTTVASGIPVLLLAPLPPVVQELLGADVVAALDATAATDLADPDDRERASVLQRRAVLSNHTARRRLIDLADDLGLRTPEPPTVTVVLATNRPDFVEHACQQIARQDWPRLEVITVAHHPDLRARLAVATRDHLADVPTTVLEADTRWTLGDALNLGIEHAGGEIITKFDDDDWYSPHHVSDLVAALEHSGADITGKAAEFVHLAAAELTLRRWGQGGESASATLAGGTLTFPRDVWRDVAGFPNLSLGEDGGFIRAVQEAGGTTYRTHPFGYLLHRHGSHAWTADDQTFLDAAVATRPGRDHHWTLT